MSSHFMQVCSAGHVLAQCRCPGTKVVTVNSGPCRCPAGTVVAHDTKRAKCGRCGGTHLYITGDEYACSDCEKHDRENMEPTITVPRAVLEKALRDGVRDAYGGGIEFALRKPPLSDADAHARQSMLVERILAELEQA